MDIISKAEAKAQGLKHYFTGLACKREHAAERRVNNKNCCQCETERSQRPDVKAYDAKRKQTPKARVKQAKYRHDNTEKIAASNAAQYKANRSERLAQREAYYKANAEKIAAQRADYYKANREKLREQSSEYYQANREKQAEKNAAYRQANRVELAAKKAAYAKANAEKIAAKRVVYVKDNRHIINALNAKRRAAKLQATPLWVDFEAIKAVYRLCAEVTRITGEQNHVDHIYPLISDEVCGLHVAANLQILTATDNIKKSNKLLLMPETP